MGLSHLSCKGTFNAKLSNLYIQYGENSSDLSMWIGKLKFKQSELW